MPAVRQCRWFGSLLVILLALAAAPARAVDGVTFEGGWGSSDTAMARASMQWDWKTRFVQGADWHVGGCWDLGVAYWNHGNTSTGQNDDLFDFSVTPVFRLQPNGFTGPYVEAGVGAHLLTKSSIGNREFGSAYQFGSHAGAGFRFGPKGAFDIGYRLQHISNADINKPNDGINFQQVRVQFHY